MKVIRIKKIGIAGDASHRFTCTYLYLCIFLQNLIKWYYTLTVFRIYIIICKLFHWHKIILHIK